MAVGVGGPGAEHFFCGAMKEMRASGEYEERLSRRPSPGLALVSAVRAERGSTSGLAHHSDIIPVADVPCPA